MATAPTIETTVTEETFILENGRTERIITTTERTPTGRPLSTHIQRIVSAGGNELLPPGMGVQPDHPRVMTSTGGRKQQRPRTMLVTDLEQVCVGWSGLSLITNSRTIRNL